MKRTALISLLGAASLALSACAFQPLYGDAGQVSAIRSVTIAVDGQERVDQMLAEALNDRFGTPAGGRFRLVTETDTNTSGLGVGADDIASRAVLRLSVDFSLVDTRSGTPELTETVNTEATFDIPAEPFAAISARRDAEERAARDAADRIAVRVARHIHRTGR
ncbi:LPS assembly lipoprotein LptE [Hyphobacterium sp.]|uniref:LPS assembly lipoprotein LptE n=1 Tax=Hyphobacterium sp. TaxID=2004662 RepID=UPI003BA97DC8